MVYAKYITRAGKDGSVYLGSKPVPKAKKKQKENKMNLRQLKDMLAGVF
jgi:hypothetical protein